MTEQVILLRLWLASGFRCGTSTSLVDPIEKRLDSFAVAWRWLLNEGSSMEFLALDAREGKVLRWAFSSAFFLDPNAQDSLVDTA